MMLVDGAAAQRRHRGQARARRWRMKAHLAAADDLLDFNVTPLPVINKQGENLPEQGRGSLASDRISPNCCERFSGYPLILHRTPNPTAVMPEPAVRTELQVLATGEMLIEHPGDNELGGIAFVFGPGRLALGRLFLRHVGRWWAALIYFGVGEVGMEAVLAWLGLVIIL
jgi:hypothetical protein